MQRLIEETMLHPDIRASYVENSDGNRYLDIQNYEENARIVLKKEESERLYLMLKKLHG